MNRIAARFVALTLLAGVLAAACGGGDENKNSTKSAAREPRDPRSVPTATVPLTIPSPIPAIDLGAPQPGKPTPPPDQYTVQTGDTPSGIARQLGVDVNELLRFNGITDASRLAVGQQLKVPRPSPTPTVPGARPSVSPSPGASPGASRTPTAGSGSATPSRGTATATATATATSGAGGTYTVKDGDTGCSIARDLGVPLGALATTNGTTIPGLASLKIGQQLKVPIEKGAPGC